MFRFEMNLQSLFLCILFATSSTPIRLYLGVSVHVLSQTILTLHSVSTDLTEVRLLLSVRYHVILEGKKSKDVKKNHLT